jgi:hypothetical protein
MTKLRVLVMALVACFAVGSVAVAVAKPDDNKKPKIKKIKTKVKVNYQAGQAPSTYNPYAPYDPYDPDGTNASFTGKVKAKKDCDRRRKVSISGLGQTSTSKDGQYSFTLPTNAASPGNYKVRVKGKRYSRGSGDRKKKFKCKPTEKTLTIVAARAG